MPLLTRPLTEQHSTRTQHHPIQPSKPRRSRGAHIHGRGHQSHGDERRAPSQAKDEAVPRLAYTVDPFIEERRQAGIGVFVADVLDQVADEDLAVLFVVFVFAPKRVFPDLGCWSGEGGWLA